MEFLKDILGEGLFKQCETAVNAYNEANKDKPVKLANLATGEYVGKGKFDALNEQLAGKQTELESANGLIAELKKGTSGNEDLQGKITTYEAKVAELQAELNQTKVDTALKVALLEAKAVDVDYLTFKIKGMGEIKIGEDGKIKDIDSRITAMKNQYPSQFSPEPKKKIEENKLLTGDDLSRGMTKEEILKKPYSERMKFYQENPDAYNEIMHSENKT